MSRRLAWLPFTDRAEAERLIGAVPDSVEVDFYTAEGPLPDSVGEVNFFVIPDPLWQVPDVLISPHVGGASTAFFPRADKLIAAQLARWVAGDELENVIR
jgi:phosphoglycerate dehydrogenase-like enzyme